jgi:hypothetical protein
VIGESVTEATLAKMAASGHAVVDRLAGVFSALDLSGPNVLWALLMFLLTSVAGLAAAGFILVKLPATYFCERTAPPAHTRRGVNSWAGRVAKNLLGGVMIVLGAVMALPGVPGPGTLMMLIGITLTDLPAMRRLERWVVSRPGVLTAVNRLRVRWGNAPMVLEGGPAWNRPTCASARGDVCK